MRLTIIPPWPYLPDEPDVTILQTWPTLRLRCDVCGAWWEVDSMAELILLNGFRCPFAEWPNLDYFGLLNKAVDEDDYETVDFLTREIGNNN